MNKMSGGRSRFRAGGEARSFWRGERLRDRRLPRAVLFPVISPKRKNMLLRNRINFSFVQEINLKQE